MAPLNLAAAITAGGQSRRFGSDKALAKLDGRALLRWVADSLDAFEPLLLIAPPGKYDALLPGWRVIADSRPGQGPLAGLEAALSHAPPGWVAFAGVDQPMLTPAYWELLAQHHRGDVQAVLGLDDSGRPQPLAALYHTAALPQVTVLLDAGERRLRTLETALSMARVPWAEIASVAPLAYQNVNTPADLNMS